MLHSGKFKIKFNALTFRDAHNATSRKRTFRDVEEQDVAKNLKLNLTWSLFSTLSYVGERYLRRRLRRRRRKFTLFILPST